MSDRKPLISGNWKMNQNHFEAIQLIQALSYELADDDPGRVDVSVHPPFTDLRSVQTVIEADGIPVLLGAQHCHSEEKGAFTGEVAAPMLAKLNVKLVICGHSERRELFGETDGDVNAKVKAILQNEMTPILCCGETLAERENGLAETKVASQLEAGLAGVSNKNLGTIVVAYEPIWAIGTGATATPEDAQAMCAHVRSTVRDIGGSEAASSVRVQYGGSVKPTNASELMAQPDIDGALVGGASLEASAFARIVNFGFE